MHAWELLFFGIILTHCSLIVISEDWCKADEFEFSSGIPNSEDLTSKSNWYSMCLILLVLKYHPFVRILFKPKKSIPESSHEFLKKEHNPVDGVSYNCVGVVA